MGPGIHPKLSRKLATLPGAAAPRPLLLTFLGAALLTSPFPRSNAGFTRLFSCRHGVLQHTLPCHDLYTFSEQKNMEGFMTQSPGLSWLVPKAVRFSLGSLGRRKSQESPCTKLRSGVHPGLEPV